MHKSSDRPAELDGVTKTAILLLNLDPPAVEKLLQRLSPATVDEVKRAIASLGNVPGYVSAAVIEEFYTLRLTEGGPRSGSAADRSDAQAGPFSFLQHAEVE